MAGYQTIEALRPILHRGPPVAPVVNRDLVRPTGAAAKRKPYHGKRGVRISDEIVAEIIARRERGESYLKITADLGVSPGAIKRYAGHVQPPNGRWLNCYETGARPVLVRNKAFAERLRRAGFSYREIGDELGCSMSEARRLLLGSKPRKCKRSAIYDTLRRVERATGIPRQSMKKDSFGHHCRAADLTKARHIAFWIIRTFQPNLSFPAIGMAMGGFHHTSVMHGYQKADAAMRALKIVPDSKPQAIAHALWKADWREVGQ